MNYALLTDLLPLLADYQEATPAEGQHISSFAAWLQARTTEKAPSGPAFLAGLPSAQPAARTPASPYESEASVMSKLLTFVYRYVRGYTRHALADTPLVGFDDFICLISLFADGPGTRSELMLRTIQEKAAGTEVIRRLLRHALVSEAPHPTDRRRKILQISEKGRGLLFSIIDRMSQVAQMATGDLSPTELHSLVHLLHRLDAFHFPIFAGSRPESFTALLTSHFPGVQPNWPPPGAPTAQISAAP